MRILADENIDRPIAAWLREQGHDVVEAATVAPEAADAELIAISRREGRILMTFDRDIGGHFVTVKNEQIRRRSLPIQPT